GERAPGGVRTEGARIEAFPGAPQRGQDAVEPVRTDSEGRFGLPALAPGAWSLRVRAPHRSSTTIALTLPDDALDELHVELAPAAIVRGRVVDPRGEPCPQAVVLEARGRSVMLTGCGLFVGTQ